MTEVAYQPVHLELPPEQPGPFAPCILLLDASSSMSSCIHEVNNGLDDLQRTIEEDELARNRADIALIEIKSQASCIVPPTLGRDFIAPTMNASGTTAIGAGLTLGLRTLRDRRFEYRANGCRAFTAMMFLITDGKPTDRWESAAAEVHRLAGVGRLEFFGIGTSSADMATLAQISPPQRPPMTLRDGCFRELFRWISDSLSDVSNSQPEGGVRLGPADSWGYMST